MEIRWEVRRAQLAFDRVCAIVLGGEVRGRWRLFDGGTRGFEFGKMVLLGPHGDKMLLILS